MFRIRPGLTALERVLDVLDHPERRFKALHIAGTNGKGSVSAALDSILRAAGYRVGLYTSPHFLDVCERIRIQHRPILQDTFARLSMRLRQAEQMAGEALTYFEFVTALAFLYFAEQQVDWAVIETGLGGRWDATNVIPAPEAAVITSIGRDHMQWLGNTERKIAREKAGIIKSPSPVISGVRGEGQQVIASLAEKKHVSLLQLDDDFSAETTETDWLGRHQTIRYQAQGEAAVDYPCRLLGSYQADNMALVLATITALQHNGHRIPKSAVRLGLWSVVWPGRCELYPSTLRASLLLDGAHNPPAVERLIETISQSPWANQPKSVVMAVYRDKDYRTMARAVAPWADSLYLCRVADRRALPVLKLAVAFKKAKARAQIQRCASPAAAVQQALAHTPKDGLVVVLGSLALLGTLYQNVSGRSPMAKGIS